MSWSSQIRIALALSAALISGGCFQPLYSEAAHPGLVEDLRAIEVAPVPDRTGHYLTDNLISRLNGTGSTPTAKYRLAISYTEREQAPTVESQINVADASTLIGDAKYILTKIAGGATIASGSASAFAVYDKTEQRFANLRAKRDAQIRVARSLADEIDLRLAAELAFTR